MLHRIGFVIAIASVGLIVEVPTICLAQTQVLSSEPPNVEYQYQMYYPRFGGYGGYGGYGGGYGGHGGYGGGYGGYGGYGWSGPGLALGGSLPSRGREGISSFYGLPLPVPLGSGVFMNPYAYSARLPGPNAFGLAASAAPSTATPSPNGQPIMQAGGSPFMPNGSAIQPAATSTNPLPRPVSASSPETLERSRTIESLGDENLKQHQWTQAFVNYRNAVETADDRAEAHTRLGFACLALMKFPEAAREFKRALTIDPATAQSAETLTSIYGPESRTLRSEVTRGVAQWAKEDLMDQDRLFLLGVVLRYDQDPRAMPILEAAYRVTGSGDHLVALLTPVQSPVVQVLPSGATIPSSEIPPAPAPTPQPPELMVLPPLHQQPLALQLQSR